MERALPVAAASTAATVVALAPPALLSRLGTDPAFGPGPISTVVQELLSIVVYLSFTTALVT